jgi:hypothetical protein
MTILDKAKAAANELAQISGGVWVVLGNPEHVPYFTEMRDVSITEAHMANDYMLSGDAILYRTEAV